MIQRTTTSTMSSTAARGLQENMRKLAQIQETAIDRKKLRVASDDPAAAMQAMAVRAEQQSNVQQSRNISNADNWLSTADSTMTSMLDILRRVRTLTLQGANDGVASPAAKDGLAKEIEALGAEVLKLANAKYGGRSVFAGTSAAAEAFSGSPVTFQGDAGSSVVRRIGNDFSVRVDVDGGAVFGSGAGSLFDVVEGIVSDLRDGTNTIGRIGALDARVQGITAALADVGARHTTVQRAEDGNQSAKLTLEGQRAGLEDADLADVITSLTLQESYYQAALGVTAKVLQNNLMDYLR
jgi:flagellar hook-associated protein 3 FlgL